MKTELIFVRHGETSGNRSGLLHGRTDLPLTPSGEEQARRVARRIESLPDIDALFSSPLKRARATAHPIAVRTGAELEIDQRLTEFDFGDLEGLSFEELQDRYPEYYLSIIDPEGFSRSFPNGESRRDLHDRVVEATTSLLTTFRGSRLVVVSHLIVIGSAVAHLSTGDPNDIVRFLVQNGSVTHLEIDGGGIASIQVLNDVSHLDCP